MTDTETPIRSLLSPQDVPATGKHVKIGGDPALRAALARFAEVVEVLAFEADLEVRPWSGDGFAVTGRVTARLVQTCVVTLEPVQTAVDEAVDVKLVPPEVMDRFAVVPDEDGGIDLDAAALDMPDPIEDGVIDLGALVTEHLLLGIDPYPRKPGVVFDAEAAGVGAGSISPFAALARLKKE